jgi:uncharacterized protein YdaU (DUF1376 family)
MEIEMHYYTFNIGDYRRDTSHLTLLEHGIYRQLLDTYYLSEQPLCGDDAKLMRTHGIRTKDEIKAFQNVLKDFFDLDGELYIHKGCEKHLEQYRKKSEKASQSAKARWVKDANGMRTHSERNANGMLTNNQEPITNNQEPIEKTIRRQAAVSCPDGVNEQVWKDFVSTRKAKITSTALSIISKEAQKAGWTLEAALQECAARGWRGFKADWVSDRPKMTQHQMNQAATANALFGRSLPSKTIEMERSDAKLITG